MLALVRLVLYFMPMHKEAQATQSLITTADAAQMLGVHVATVSRMVASGRLVPAIKVPGKTGAFLFHPEDVAALRGESNG